MRRVNKPNAIPTYILLSLLMSMSALSACSKDETRQESAGADAGGVDSGDLCPNAADPRVHYREKDPNVCRTITLQCSAEQNGFDNACGCGCIDKGSPLCPPFDDPAITWVSRDPSQCEKTPPICPMGENPFSSSCGCGCSRPGG